MDELCVDSAVIIESGGLFTTLCVNAAVYYRVWWIVYHAMCRLLFVYYRAWWVVYHATCRFCSLRV